LTTLRARSEMPGGTEVGEFSGFEFPNWAMKPRRATARYVGGPTTGDPAAILFTAPWWLLFQRPARPSTRILFRCSRFGQVRSGPDWPALLLLKLRLFQPDENWIADFSSTCFR
jgi:hypothetical protein